MPVEDWESNELSPGKHLLPTHPHSTPMGALSHKTWVLELPDPLLKVSLRAWADAAGSLVMCNQFHLWAEWKHMWLNLDLSGPSTAAHPQMRDVRLTLGWRLKRASQPPSTRLRPQLVFSRFSTHLQEGTLAACLLWVFFPSSFLYLAVANALGPQQPLAPYLFRETGMVETYAQGCSHRFLWANPQRNSGVENRLLSHLTGMSTNEHFFLGLVSCVPWSQMKSWISDSRQMLTWLQAECLDTF